MNTSTCTTGACGATRLVGCRRRVFFRKLLHKVAFMCNKPYSYMYQQQQLERLIQNDNQLGLGSRLWWNHQRANRVSPRRVWDRPTGEGRGGLRETRRSLTVPQTNKIGGHLPSFFHAHCEAQAGLRPRAVAQRLCSCCISRRMNSWRKGGSFESDIKRDTRMGEKLRSIRTTL